MPYALNITEVIFPALIRKQITLGLSPQVRCNITTNTPITPASLQIFNSRAVWDILASAVAASCSSAWCGVLRGGADSACKSSGVSGMLMRPIHQRAVSLPSWALTSAIPVITRVYSPSCLRLGEMKCLLGPSVVRWNVCVVAAEHTLSIMTDCLRVQGQIRRHFTGLNQPLVRIEPPGN